MAFKRGLTHAQEQAEKAKPKGDEDKPQYLTLKDGEFELVRLLHDGDAWYSYMQHGYLPLREPSADWPDRVQKFYREKTMGATCQRDENIGGDYCFACDDLHMITPNPRTAKAKRASNRGRYFPQQRYLIPVLIRREIVATQEMIDSGEVPATLTRNGREVPSLNRPIAVVDQTEERDEIGDDGEKTGRRVQVPMIRLVEHPYDTSIAALTAEYLDSEDRTVLDRDFKLTRQGEMLETKYLWTSRKPIQYRNEQGEELIWDLGDKDLFAPYERYIPDIEKIITERATPEYYAKFFDPRAPFFEYEDDEEGGSATKDASNGAKPAVVKEEPLDDATKDALAKVKESLLAGLKG